MANKSSKQVKPVKTKALNEERSLADRFLAKETKAVNVVGKTAKRAVHLEVVRTYVRQANKGDNNA